MLTNLDLLVILEDTSALCHFAGASFLSGHMAVRRYPYNTPAVCPLHCSFFLFIRIWKRVTACLSQPINRGHLHPPVLETSPHWTSPMMMIYPQTPATPQTRRTRVGVSRLSPVFPRFISCSFALVKCKAKVCKARSYKRFCSYFHVYGKMMYEVPVVVAEWAINSM